MIHHFPDSGRMDDDYSIPSLFRTTKSTMDEGDRIMELLWHNGQVVTESQRSIKKTTPTPSNISGDDDLLIAAAPNHQSTPLHHHQNNNLFLQEDEMASWLHYHSLNDPAPFSLTTDFNSSSDLLYSSPPCINAAGTATATIESASAIRSPFALEPTRQAAPAPSQRRPPIPPTRRLDNSFGYLLRQSNGALIDSTALNSTNVAISLSAPAASSDAAGSELPACELTVTSSPGGSSASAEPPPIQRAVPIAPPKDRKRKCRDPDDGDCHSKDVELDQLGDAKKHLRGSSSTKRSRAVEVHNLSERRRRDRINGKMKALQELIPHCNKADKSSMLDEAIDYLKSLQLQVQMMSTGCGMVPMMFPGVQQQYIPIPHIRMGMGMNRLMMMPFPNNLLAAGGSMPTVPAGAHHLVGPRFPMQPMTMFHVQQQQLHGAGLGADPSRFIIPPRSCHRADPIMLSSNNLVHSPIHPPRIPPNAVDPYHHHQYLGLHHVQMPPFQPVISTVSSLQLQMHVNYFFFFLEVADDI